MHGEVPAAFADGGQDGQVEQVGRHVGTGSADDVHGKLRDSQDCVQERRVVPEDKEIGRAHV